MVANSVRFVLAVLTKVENFGKTSISPNISYVHSIWNNNSEIRIRIIPLPDWSKSKEDPVPQDPEPYKNITRMQHFKCIIYNASEIKAQYMSANTEENVRIAALIRNFLAFRFYSKDDNDDDEIPKYLCEELDII